MKIRLPAAVALVALLLTACDEMMQPSIPQVAGTYNGTLTILVPDLGISEQLAMRMSVEQSGSRITASGAFTYQGAASTFVWPGTIDETGLFTGDSSGGPIDPASLDTDLCGRIQPISARLTFSGRRAVFSALLRASQCGLISYDAILTR